MAISAMKRMHRMLCVGFMRMLGLALGGRQYEAPMGHYQRNLKDQ